MIATTGRVALPWIYDDGGRTDAGFRGEARDCVARAIAIVTGLPYRDVYDDLHDRNRAADARSRRQARSTSPRDGIPRAVYEAFLFDLGWLWTPAMHIGSGCQTHLAVGEVPDAVPIVARLSRHVCAVVGGVVRDTHDPTRGGTRCVYGWYEPGADAVAQLA